MVGDVVGGGGFFIAQSGVSGDDICCCRSTLSLFLTQIIYTRPWVIASNNVTHVFFLNNIWCICYNLYLL